MISIRGREGILDRVVDVNGNVLDQNIEREAVPGDAVVLTIDQDLQEQAYNLIGERTGAVIVSETGNRRDPRPCIETLVRSQYFHGQVHRRRILRA